MLSLPVVSLSKPTKKGGSQAPARTKLPFASEYVIFFLVGFTGHLSLLVLIKTYISINI